MQGANLRGFMNILFGCNFSATIAYPAGLQGPRNTVPSEAALSEF